MDELKYPIGAFSAPQTVTDEQVRAWIAEIERFPAELRKVVGAMSPAELDTRYRPGGWTARQVVHHLADSHLNSYVRFKWALTEDEPQIKAYHEERWAELVDYGAAVEISLDLLDALHTRWALLLKGLGTQELDRAFIHPESGPVTLRVNCGIYAWHGRHHLAHVELARAASATRAQRLYGSGSHSQTSGASGSAARASCGLRLRAISCMSSNSSCSSTISAPSRHSRTSSKVTTPSNPPYSSATATMCLRSLMNRSRR